MPSRTEKIEELENEIFQLKRLLDQYSLAFANTSDVPDELMENIQNTYKNVRNVKNFRNV